MKEYLFNNKISYQMNDEKKSLYWLWLSMFLGIFIFLCCTIKISIKIPMTATYNIETNTLELYWPFEKIDKISQIKRIKVENTEINFQIINMSELKVDEINKINYQIITISSPKKFYSNQMIKVYLLDEEEPIIQKVKKWILGG